MIPWTVEELDALARDYPADAHADVAALIAGARRVLALTPTHAPEPCSDPYFAGWFDSGEAHLSAAVRALSLEESP